MSNIIFLNFILLYVSRPTIQLSCLKNCSIIQVNYSEPLIESLHRDSHVNNPSMKIYKGKIIAYYHGNDFPIYIDYSFEASIDHRLDRQYENTIHQLELEILKRYQVIINAKQTETIIQADIYCTIDKECISAEMNNLFIKYSKQKNPFYELKTLIYVDPPPKKLSCFDRSNNIISKRCAIKNEYPICISHLHGSKSECSSKSDVYVYEEFIITSPVMMSFSLVNELVKCNKDNCNAIETLAKIENITKSYAYGTVIMKNNVNRQGQGIMYIFLWMLLPLLVHIDTTILFIVERIFL